MSRLCLIFILLGSSAICIVETARILAVLPTPSISHQVVFRPLMLELVNCGHEVVVITADPAYPKGSGPSNLTEIDLHDISYGTVKEIFSSKKRESKENVYDQFKFVLKLFTAIFDRQLENDEIRGLLNDKTKKFDLLFIEACVRTALLFSHFFKAPIILISSFGTVIGNEELIGAPIHQISFPSARRQRINNLSMWEKITELYMYYSMHIYYNYFEQEDDKLLKKHFGAEFPSISELKNNVDILFLNVYPIWQGNHPVPPSVVYMGEMHLKPEKELPQELKTYFDSSENGVIYLSFGTSVRPSQLPSEKIRVLVSVLSQLPYDVLWKWDKDELPGRAKNIRTSKWFPQPDLLRHPKIKLFITQGGLQSTDEAIIAGVPLIGIPMLADQWYNAEKYVYHKIGLQLDMDTITEESFKGAIETIINNKSYRRNIVKLRELIKDQPQTRRLVDGARPQARQCPTPSRPRCQHILDRIFGTRACLHGFISLINIVRYIC